MKTGDSVIIIGNKFIAPHVFNSGFPQGLFGIIKEVSKHYCILRVYKKGGSSIEKHYKNYLKDI